MLQESLIIPNVVNTVTFANGFSFLRLLDAKAEILLNMRISVPDGRIFINDQPEIGVWGARQEILLPSANAPDRFTLHFKVENELVLWNSTAATSFARFTKETGERVRYAVLNNAQDTGKSLITSVREPGEMSARIATKVMLRRMDQLEAQVAQAANTTDR